MNIKAITLTLAALLISAASSFAQNDKTNKKQYTGNCPVMTVEKCKAFEGIELTDAQKEQLKAVCQTNQDKAVKTRENRRKEAQTKRREHLNQIKAILTPEQYVVFLENNYVDGARHQQMRKGKAPGRNGGMQKAKCPGAGNGNTAPKQN